MIRILTAALGFINDLIEALVEDDRRDARYRAAKQQQQNRPE